MYFRLTLVSAFVCAVLLQCVAAAENWPQFRGPNGDGQAPGARFPTEWSEDKNVAWKTAIPGVGWSAPIVWNDRVFVTTATAEQQDKPKNFKAGGGSMLASAVFGSKPPDVVHRWEVMCLDRATGRALWRKAAAEGKPTIPKHASNTYATETPATDGERVYAWFASTGILAAYDLAGNEVWRKELGVWPMGADFGTGSSPLLTDGVLFIQCDNEKQSFLTAMDPSTGEELWRAPRDGKSSWSTPFIWRTNGRSELVACGEKKVTSYDPRSGAVLWELGGIVSGFASSPAATGEQLFLGNSGPFTPAPLFGIRAGGRGDITLDKGATSNQFVAWSRNKSGPGLASPIVVGERLYVASEGILSAYQIASGERVYRQRLPGGKSVVASAWAAEGRLFFLDESGQTSVVRPGDQFELLATNQLEGLFWSTPAVAGDSLFVRSAENLYCIQ